MTRQDTSRSDRALELYEKKTPMWIIAERLGLRSSHHVYAMIEQARARREKRAGEVVE